MRLDVAGENVGERLGLLAGLVPYPLVQVSMGMGYARGITAGVRLGVFEALVDGDADVAELAERTSCHRDGMRGLANTLAGFGLLRRRAGRYSLTKPSRKWLVRGAKDTLVDAVKFLGYCNELSATLEQDVRTGEVVRIHDMEHPPEFWDAYMRALAGFAKVMSKELFFRSGLEAGTRMLDVGGGHGLYGGLLSERIPGLETTVLDLPEACAVGRAIVEEEGYADRITHVEGDFHTTEWGDGFDMVLISNVLHNATREEGAALVAKAKAALAPGGTLVISDAAHPGGDGRVNATAGWNELFFYLVSGAGAWPEETMVQWMEDVGFASVRTKRLISIPQVVILGTA